MEQSKCAVSTVCYLIKDDQVLFLHFNKKWGQVFCPPGGKAMKQESPLECILREFKEETGLSLKNVKLKGYSYWDYIHEKYGIIFLYTADEYSGTLKEGEEGNLLWVKTKEIKNLKQFDMNEKFSDLIFEDGLFEGHFELDQEDKVISYKIKKL